MKTFSIKIDPLTGEEYYEVYLRGRQLITDPFLNKGTGFTEEERLTLGLDGLTRSCVSDIEVQRTRNYEMYTRSRMRLRNTFFSSRCSTGTRSCFTIFSATTSRRCFRSCTRRPWGRRA